MPPGKVFGQAAGHLHRETRFADPSWAGDGEKAHILTQQKFFGGSYFLLAPHERRPLHGNIRRPGLYLLNRLFREMVAYGCQFAREIPSGDVALIGLFRQTPLDGPAQRSGGVEVSDSDRFRLVPAGWPPVSPPPCFS